MTFVLDASLTLAWCFREESTDFTNRALAETSTLGAVAPDLWAYEIANGLLNGMRRNRISEEDATRFLDALERLPIECVRTEPSEVYRSIRLLAAGQLITVYDAAYLALAIQRGVPIATLDGVGRRQGLKQAAARCWIPVHGP